MNFTAEQLQENYDKFLSYIDQYIKGERVTQLKQLYMDHAERIMLMPASSVDHHHNAFPGGYIDHVIRVMDCALKLKDAWASMGAYINFSEEELIFAAMNHDLGKIGTEEAEQYQPNDSEWHRKNQGKMYKINPENPFMIVPDRSLFLLQSRGIKVSFNEYIGIKIHDGLYEDANKSYFMSSVKESKLRSSLPIILHHADHMASRIEFEMWDRANGTERPKVVVEKRKPTIPTDLSENQKDDLMNVFNNLFK